MNRMLPIVLTVAAALGLLTGCQSTCDAALNGVRDRFEACGDTMASEFKFNNCEADPSRFECAERCLRDTPCEMLSTPEERVLAFGECLVTCGE